LSDGRAAAERGASCDVEMSLVSELVMSCEEKREREREKPPPDAKVREIERRSECRFISGDPSERASERGFCHCGRSQRIASDLMKLFTLRQVYCVTFYYYFHF
jgi:hypothetical protein